MIFQYTSKPTIIVSVSDNLDDSKVKQIEYGIEEEGIPYDRQTFSGNTDIVSVAHDAATQSLLLVGIACNETEAVLHYRTLKKEQFLYRLTNYRQLSHEDLRSFGSNAARLVKGIPFKKIDVVEVSF